MNKIKPPIEPMTEQEQFEREYREKNKNHKLVKPKKWWERFKKHTD